MVLEYDFYHVFEEIFPESLPKAIDSPDNVTNVISFIKIRLYGGKFE